jgi:hypothetical protein
MPSFGGRFELRYRTLGNEDYSAVDYEREHDLALRYSRSSHQFVYGAEVEVGRDVFGERFGRVGGFLRLVPGEPELSGASVAAERSDLSGRVQVFVDGGVNVTRLAFNPSDKGVTPERNVTTTGPHAAIGVRGSVSERSDFGTRVELDEIDGSTLIGVRAIDYRYRAGEKLALSLFAGAARYGVATAAYGYYGGVGAQWRDVVSGVDLNLDVRASDAIARDALLPSDPASVWGDVVYHLYSANLYLSYRF